MNGMSGTLGTKVSKDDVVSVINQTAGAVKISAACIDLSGYVTAEQLETVQAWAENFVGDSISGQYITAGNGDFDELTAGQGLITTLDVPGTLTASSLTVGESSAGWRKQTVVTAINNALRVSKTSQTITYATPEGGENTINVLTNVRVFTGGRYSTKEISYLGAGASE